MKERIFVACLVAVLGIALIFFMVLNRRQRRQAWDAAAPSIVTSSDFNALAEAMGCPQRGVSGDMLKPLMEQLRICIRDRRLAAADAARLWLPGQVLDKLGILEHQAAHLDLPLSPAQFKELKAILCAAAFDWKHPRPGACASPGVSAIPAPDPGPADRCRPAPEYGEHTVLCW